MIVTDYSKMDDHQLVDLLLQSDPDAWDYVLMDIVTPFSRSRKYREMASRYGMDTDALVTRTWLILQKNDYRRLRGFRFDSSLKTFIFKLVHEAQTGELREKIGKIPNLMSEDEDPFARIISDKPSYNPELRDEMRQTKRIFGALWQSNPQQAWVLLMRHGCELSAKEVGTLLGLNDDNVAQINKRAKASMIKLRKDFQKNEQKCNMS